MEIILVDMDDWVGLYADGELKLQGHSLSVRDVIEFLTGTRPTTLEPTYEEVERLNYSLPEKLAHIEHFS